MRISLLVAASLLLAAPLVAQEERSIDNFAGVGVRAMGMGGAYIGVADDFTAVYWNPAGLAQFPQKKREVYMTFLRNAVDNTATLGGNGASSDLSNTRFGSLGVVVPYPVYRGSLVFAGGFNRVKDFDSTLRISGFNNGTNLDEDNIFVHEGQLSITSGAVALDVSDIISLGAALHLVTGEDAVTNEFTFTDSQDLFEERAWIAQETFSDDYKRRVSTTIGAMLRTPRQAPKLRMGATLTAGTTQEVRYTFRGLFGESEFNTIEGDDGTLERFPNEELTSSYKLSLPLEFGLGASYEPAPGLLLAGSLHRAEWTQTEYSGNDPEALRADADFATQYQDITRVHLGAEWQVPVVALDLRAGFYTDPLPFVGPRDPTRTVDPDTNPLINIVQDRRFFTLGAGLLLDEVVKVDLAWTGGSYEQVEGGLREDKTISRFFGGLSYHF